MPIREVEVFNAEEVRDIIIEARKNQDISESEWALVKSLTEDYGLWFKDLGSKTSAATKSTYGKWTEGEPAWILVKDNDEEILGYASVLLANREYKPISPGKVLDVYVGPDENTLELIAAIRSAVDDLFWFHNSKRNVG